MFTGHYNNWIISRMNGVKKYIHTDFFNGKKILELGCGFGHIGNEFCKMGGIVTISDARIEHITEANRLYPHLNSILIDADKHNIQDEYDIIVHWGLLYHLKEIENHLENVSTKCKVLLLETEVFDSINDSCYLQMNESGYDQAYNGIGIRPTSFYVEKILKKNGFECKMIKDSILNADIHLYDWVDSDTKSAPTGLRRFWICWKNDTVSPLKEEYNI